MEWQKAGKEFMKLSRPIAAALCAWALSAIVAEDTKLRSEITTQDTVDTWVMRIGNEGSLLSLEARNRGESPMRVRGKIITLDSNTGAAIKQCDYELRVPARTFVSKLAKCSLSGADSLQTTIEELVSENQ